MVRIIQFELKILHEVNFLDKIQFFLEKSSENFGLPFDYVCKLRMRWDIFEIPWGNILGGFLFLLASLEVCAY
jgi:hypothetical protein